MTKKVRRWLVLMLLVLLVLVAAVASFLFHAEKQKALDAAIFCDFTELRVALRDYHKRNGKWERIMPAPRPDASWTDLVDPSSGEPYRCLAEENVYVYLPEERRLKKVFVMAKPRRTAVWPFGGIRTVILCGGNQVVEDMHRVSPERIIELAPEYQVTEKNLEGD